MPAHDTTAAVEQLLRRSAGLPAADTAERHPGYLYITAPFPGPPLAVGIHRNCAPGEPTALEREQSLSPGESIAIPYSPGIVVVVADPTPPAPQGART